MCVFLVPGSFQSRSCQIRTDRSRGVRWPFLWWGIFQFGVIIVWRISFFQFSQVFVPCCYFLFFNDNRDIHTFGLNIIYLYIHLLCNCKIRVIQCIIWQKTNKWRMHARSMQLFLSDLTVLDSIWLLISEFRWQVGFCTQL